MKNKDYKLLRALVSKTQPQLRKYMRELLEQFYGKSNTLSTADYLCAKGSIPIVLVAHLDTVFKAPPKELFYDQQKQVLWAPGGAGFDDRAGVFAIIKLLQTGVRPHIALCCDEEIGCAGAQSLAAVPCPFNEVRYLIEIDRRGSNDCVFYDCDNPSFTTYIESFGFKEAFGSFTDITELGPAWNAASVNLSCGYALEHTPSEYLHLPSLYSTINKIKVMLRQVDIPTFAHIPRIKCNRCGQHHWEYDLLPIQLRDSRQGFFCVDCLAAKAEYCEKCGCLFEKTKEGDRICAKCS